MEYKNPIKEGKVNWSEPRHKDLGYEGKSEIHLQNAESKKPVRNPESEKYQVPAPGEHVSGLLNKDFVEEDKKAAERSFLRNDVNKHLKNIFSSNQFTDEEKIDQLKNIADKEGLNTFDVRSILRDHGLNEDREEIENKIYDAIGGYNGQELGDLPEKLANSMYLDAYTRGDKNRNKNWYRDQINRALDYVSALSRNNTALDYGSYYPKNSWAGPMNQMLRDIAEGKDIKDQIVSKEVSGDNFWSDNDYAYENRYDIDEERPQEDIDNAVRRNTEPGKYRDNMQARKEAMSLEDRLEGIMKKPYQSRTQEERQILDDYMKKMGMSFPIRNW